MRLQINGSDLLFIPACGLAAFQVDWKWSLAIPVIILSWFFFPRWSKHEGWRFLR